MKKIFKIAFLLLLLGACKDPIDNECTGTDCPLPDGTYCPGNTINVDNNCVCPEGNIMLNSDFCYDTNTNQNNFYIFYGNINCSCQNDDFIILIDTNNVNISGMFRIINYEDNLDAYLNVSNGSTINNFDASLYPYNCGINNILKIHGSISNDTLTYFFYITNPYDTCATQQIVAL